MVGERIPAKASQRPASFGTQQCAPHARPSVCTAGSYGGEGRGVCVFITAGPITKLFAGGGGGEWTTCAMIGGVRVSYRRTEISGFELSDLNENEVK